MKTLSSKKEAELLLNVLDALMFMGVVNVEELREATDSALEKYTLEIDTSDLEEYVSNRLLPYLTPKQDNCLGG